MIAFSKDDIENFSAHLKHGKLDSKDDTSIEEPASGHAYVYPFYSPPVFVRVGLFFLTIFVVLLVFSLLWLLTATSVSNLALATLCTVTGSLCILASEYFARKRKHYQSGIDEALHCSIVFFFSIPLFLLFNIATWITLLLASAISFCLFLRYLSSLQAGICAICLFISLAFFAEEFYPAFIYALPLSLLAGASCFFLMNHDRPVPVVYRSGLVIIRYCLLCLALFFSNFICLAALGGMYISDSFISITYKVTTVLFPILLLWYGVFKRDIIAIHVSMVSLIFALYSVYEFTGREQPFAWMTIGGLFMIVICAFLMKRLQNARGGFIYRKEKSNQNDRWVEVILPAAVGQSEPDAGGEFGGGSFGGGGASGNF